MTPPEGALTEEQRIALFRKSEGSGYSWLGKKGYYVVMVHSGDLLIGGSSKLLDGDVHKFTFSWKPGEAYYFTNYFHALAYSLQLKATKCDIQHSV